MLRHFRMRTSQGRIARPRVKKFKKNYNDTTQSTMPLRHFKFVPTIKGAPSAYL